MSIFETSRSPSSRTEIPAAQIAKLALRRLAVQRLEPTPENYERAWRQESGDGSAYVQLPASQAKPAPDAAAGPSDAFAALLERIVRGLEMSGRSWTPARRREGFQRVLASSRHDARRLQHRLTQLVNSWDNDVVQAPADPAAPAAAPGATPAAVAAPETLTDFAALDTPAAPAAIAEDDEMARTGKAIQRAMQALGHALQAALPRQDGANAELAAELEEIGARFGAEGASHRLADELEDSCKRAERVMQHRHHLFAQLGKLCHELTASMGDLAENESWVKGQCEAMRVKIEEGLTARGVRQVSDMLHHARKRHNEVRGEREEARDALKTLIAQMLGEIGELGSKTGDFEQNMGRYAEVIENSDSLESLAGVVRELVAESRSVQQVVQQTQTRLQQEHSKATGLSERVTELENEMRRLSDEVSTDQLTQISNRRGLAQAFETEKARLERSGGALSIGLLDIDNFKRLNDELGHSAGDEALKSLAALVSKTLRPTDSVARYGGEEFVVLLPDTPVNEGEQILTRLQRSLTGGLFMHKEKQIFVTFSAGVTSYRDSERIETALERADQALYEAKRTGKNRTCIA